MPGQYYASQKGIFERRSKPASDYPTLVDMTASYHYFDKSHRAYADLYLSFAKDVSDDVYAEIVDPAFRDVTDPFARKDKVAELQPKIAAYKESIVGKSPNVTVIVDQSIKLSPYNMETGTYQVL